ncbi:MAG TPA: hypothetical protein VIG51_00655 [Candidatus Baltobacteraceae bacterium]|jgi:photosystem II stability/assembly factor-like uncharacterized protein
MRCRSFALVAFFVAVVCGHARAAAIDPSVYSSLQFRNVGPTSGRIDAVSGVPGDPRTYYVGGLGGMFKTEDGGATWTSVFEKKPVSSVDAIAVAPSSPTTIYAGTGEANLRNDVVNGDGVWKSTDSGATWTHAGLDDTAYITAIAVQPTDANVAYVAALGDVYAPSKARGIYRTTDGGTTWKQVLYTDERTGGSSIAIDPADPKKLFAGMWEGWRNPYHLNSGGPTDGIYTSSDGGDSWTRLRGSGLPTGTLGRIALAFAPSNPKRIYALIESKEGTLWRSDDTGKTWQLMNKSHGIDQRPFYFTSLAVDPADQNHVYFMSVSMWQTTDGGKTVRVMHDTRGGDYHQMWIDPRDARRMVAGDDGGAEVSVDSAKTWLNAEIPVAQIYHVDTDSRVPYTICSEDQDSGSACGPSNSLAFGGIVANAWFPAGGGESGWIAFDPRNSNHIYGTGYEGDITRYDRRSRQALDVQVWPNDVMGHAAADMKYRFQWTAPIAVSTFRAHTLYFGGNRLFETNDGGLRWRAISGDLTRNDKGRQGYSGGLTRDNTSVETYDTIFTVAESPRRAGELWVGTDDGLIWLTRDGGAHWTNVTSRLPHLAPWGRVDYVDPSPHDPASAYAAIDYFKSGDRKPYLFKTSDYGRHWTPIASNLPATSFALMIKEDPKRRGMLYAGTSTGLWLSYDDGTTWLPLQNNLPVVPVYDFTIQSQFDDLVVGTHGRAIWILDDLAALRALTPQMLARDATLIAPRTAYRWQIGDYVDDRWSGKNPPYGADLNFYLRRVPANVSLDILDAGKQVIRTIKVAKPHAGLNRVWWDLRYDDLAKIEDYAPWNSGGFDGPLAIPGTYTVRLHAGNATEERALRVVIDPRSHASQAALREQLAFVLRIRGDLQKMNATIDALREARKKATAARAAGIDAQLDDLYNPEVTQGEDNLRYPIALYGRFSSLAGLAQSADAAPTSAERVVLVSLEAEMRSKLPAAKLLLANPGTIR